MKVLGVLAGLVLVLATGCSTAVDGPVEPDDEVQTQVGSPTVAALYDGAYLEPALVGEWELTQVDRSLRRERFKIALGADGVVTPSEVPAVFAADEERGRRCVPGRPRLLYLDNYFLEGRWRSISKGVWAILVRTFDGRLEEAVFERAPPRPPPIMGKEFFLSAVGGKRLRELILMVELRRGPWEPLASNSECP